MRTLIKDVMQVLAAMIIFLAPAFIIAVVIVGILGNTLTGGAV
jgi:hypothetical protein